MPKKPPNPPRRCIFCDGTGMSKEHIWSNWMKDLIPQNDEHGEYWGRLQRRRGSEAEWTEPPQSGARQGCVMQRKIKNVCKTTCNNGWMSRVVERAKPHAERLIRGESFKMDRQAQTDLAAWLSITTIMQEFATPRGSTNERRQLIPAEHRRDLMANEAPPASWSIWIGNYEGQWWSPMGHYNIPISYSKGNLSGEQQPGEPPRHALTLTTFTLDHLLVHVFTSTHDEMIETYRSYIDAASASAKLPRLWPLTDDTLDWPPPRPFSDKEVDLLAFDWAEKKWGAEGMPGRPQEIKILELAEKLAGLIAAGVTPTT
jgi:hypothetical protein